MAFGCGWTWGSDLASPATDSYPALVAKANNWTIDNNAEPSASLDGIIDALECWITRNTREHIDNSLVIIGLTDEMRGTTRQHPGEKLYTDAVTEINRIAEENDLKLIQFNVITQNYRVKLPTLLDSSSALEMLVIRDKPRKAPLFTEHKFPNEKGHTIISEFLLDKIDPVKLCE